MNIQTVTAQLATLDTEESELAAQIAAAEQRDSVDPATAALYASAPLRYRQIEGQRARLQRELLEAERVQREAALAAKRRELDQVRADLVKSERTYTRHADTHLKAAVQVATLLQRQTELSQELGESVDPATAQRAELTVNALQLVSFVGDVNSLKAPKHSLWQKAKDFVAAGFSADIAADLESISEIEYTDVVRTHLHNRAREVLGQLTATAQAITKQLSSGISFYGSNPIVQRLNQRGVDQTAINKTLSNAREQAFADTHPDYVPAPPVETPAQPTEAPVMVKVGVCMKCGQPILRGEMQCPRCGDKLR